MNMYKKPQVKYRQFPPVNLPDRQWPNKVFTNAPAWCSVDLRDGNQALINPMDSDRKMQLYDVLIRCGFKEIEVGFPSASKIDYDFIRTVIDEGLVPEDVSLQVLTPARNEHLDKTFQSLRGSKRSIVHLYNSTSTVQRKIVFKKDRKSIIQLALDGVYRVLDNVSKYPETDWVLEYSPESFSGTELDFALDICDAVSDVWLSEFGSNIIVNLPATVELSSPNIFADQIEWMSRNLAFRDKTCLSIHTHNDRGTAVAAAELGLLAGADRVEGTLFGNGERTGNVDLVTLALNLYSQGISPNLDFSDIEAISRSVEHCNQMQVHPRHPYAGELVFTAFSGSHQDAIKKGFTSQQSDSLWEVPYLPIDPADIGRNYEKIIRVNSQSGKGGISYILRSEYGLQLPRGLEIEFSAHVQDIADTYKTELTADNIWEAFNTEYLEASTPFSLFGYMERQNADGSCRIEATLQHNGQEVMIYGEGNGPLAAFVHGMNSTFGQNLSIVDYSEHATDSGSEATAIAYVEVKQGNEKQLFGVGSHSNITKASLLAVVSAANRLSGASACYLRHEQGG
ncbi:2-isopropylmalate synthase [Photobacterium gaetbulicola]|uniref:2-isopropylmalate synthase n=1 Tax=Photobacterium gaetbulicola Gung47 TaxID=658445 RepID=A0A0C5WGI8_9GAMM|nr:2-isopropylmalate synthase [Photobacterium gaetbulicola Gung47]PSU02628.1 2-isopropylmalate synthase [Photobacterium gaetbulicola]